MNATDERLDRLVASKATFLGFLAKRLGNRADAEDLLQGAMVEAIEKVETLREDERLYAWFYALLRNRITDHFRRRAARERADEKAAARSETVVEPDTELFDATCRCVNDVMETLKGDQRDVLRRVYVEERSIADLAVELATTRNNAGVKLHRARTALREALVDVCRSCADHGCLDCSCRKGVPL